MPETRGRLPHPRPADSAHLTALARLVPTLNEVVVHIGGGWIPQLDVEVVDVWLRSRRMARGRDRCRIQIDSAHESHLGCLARVDQPALLVLAEAIGQLVPARAESAAPVGEPASLGVVSGKIGRASCRERV